MAMSPVEEALLGNVNKQLAEQKAKLEALGKTVQGLESCMISAQIAIYKIAEQMVYMSEIVGHLHAHHHPPHEGNADQEKKS
jgi:hypothetical protein